MTRLAVLASAVAALILFGTPGVAAWVMGAAAWWWVDRHDEIGAK